MVNAIRPYARIVAYGEHDCWSVAWATARLYVKAEAQMKHQY
jgi:hypothetical protein